MPEDIEDLNFKNKSKITGLLREYREIRSEIRVFNVVDCAGDGNDGPFIEFNNVLLIIMQNKVCGTKERDSKNAA